MRPLPTRVLRVGMSREAEKTVLDPIGKLTKDLRDAARSLTAGEARYMVDAYYSIQAYRTSSSNQVRSQAENEEPSEVLAWFFDNARLLENQIKRALDAYTDGSVLGTWCKAERGIGPVISAGFLAHIDITRAPTAGNLWSFAGLNPAQEWDKGQIRPWNARLKTLCWKLGESFTKVCNHPDSHYGRIYRERKELEIIRNQEGDYKEQAAAKLEKFKIGKSTTAYKFYSDGLLPPAHIHARAKRYAVKMFLSHYHEVAYWIQYGQLAPVPYVLEHLGHAHYYLPPNLDIDVSLQALGMLRKAKTPVVELDLKGIL